MTCPLGLKRIPSVSKSVRCWLHPGAVRPSLFTTRWQGNPMASGEYLSTLPTILEWLGHPANAAISPYVITFPRGICLTISSTSMLNLLACSLVILSGYSFMINFVSFSTHISLLLLYDCKDTNYSRNQKFPTLKFSFIHQNPIPYKNKKNAKVHRTPASFQYILHFLVFYFRITELSPKTQYLLQALHCIWLVFRIDLLDGCKFSQETFAKIGKKL